MRTLIIILGIFALAVIGIMFWLRRIARRGDKIFHEKMELHGLKEHHQRIMTEIIDQKRPVDHIALTRMMIEIMDQISAATPQTGQAAIVEPPDEGYRLACEELVSLGKLDRHENVYLKPTQ